MNGAALQCFDGENAVQLGGGGGVLTYPGRTQLPAANCQSTLGPGGNITLYVPLSDVSEAGAIDSRLHEVAASTMTLQAQANSVPPDPVFNFGGVFFNLIGAVSRKNHGSAGTFDIDLLPPASGIECRSGGATGDFQIVVTFAVPITFTSASVSGTGSVAIALSSGNQAFVNLTGVTNAQRITVTLTGVNDGTHTADVSVPMGMLLGDTNADGFVNSADISQTKSQSGNAVTGSNFREDLNTDGFINSADISLVKSKSGTALPRRQTQEVSILP